MNVFEENVDVEIPVTKEDIATCPFQSCDSCAIAEGIKTLLDPKYVVSTALSFADIVEESTGVIVAQCILPNHMGFPQYQEEHPEGFFIPTTLPRRVLRN